MAFVIYDTTGTIFSFNASTTIENVDDDTIIYKTKYKLVDGNPCINNEVSTYIHFSNLDMRDIQHDVTVYVNTGDLVYCDDEYSKRYTKRYIEHIKSKQPDILICEGDLLCDFVKAPLVIDTETIKLNDFDHNCHCEKCCNCNHGYKYCRQKCENYKYSHPCNNDDGEILLSYKCSVKLHNLSSTKMKKIITDRINEYIRNSIPTVKNTIPSTVFLSNEDKSKLYELEKRYLHDNIYSDIGCKYCK